MTEKQIRERVSGSPQVGTCRAGNLCWFDVHVSNLTDKPFLGTLLVRIDLDPDGAEFVGVRPESWTCGHSPRCAEVQTKIGRTYRWSSCSGQARSIW